MTPKSLLPETIDFIHERRWYQGDWLINTSLLYVLCYLPRNSSHLYLERSIAHSEWGLDIAADLLIPWEYQPLALTRVLSNSSYQEFLMRISEESSSRGSLAKVSGERERERESFFKRIIGKSLWRDFLERIVGKSLWRDSFKRIVDKSLQRERELINRIIGKSLRRVSSWKIVTVASLLPLTTKDSFAPEFWVFYPHLALGWQRPHYVLVLN